MLSRNTSMIGTSSLVAWLSLASVLGNVVLCKQINCKPKDCIDLKCYRVSTGQDGPHTVYPGIASLPSVTVSCDQTVFGGGWTIWLRRCLQTNDTNFNRTWEEYKNGFGRQEGNFSEFYLGNEIVHLLTHNYPSKNGEFRFEAISYNNTSYGLSTDGFSLSSEADKYKWRAGEEYNNMNVLAGSMKYLNGRDFSTGSNKDKICRRLYKGIRWWFDRCTKFFFFGLYFNTKTVINIHMCLKDEQEIRIPIKRARMLLRPYGDTRQCDNPCKNGATCEYVAASDTSHCKCPSTHCGAFCEKTCKNKGTCVYDAKTKTEVCQCKSGFTGATCDKNAAKASGDFVFTTSDWLSVIGVALVGLAVVGLFIRWQKKKREKEKAARAREEERKKNEHSESDSFIASFFGF